MSKDLSDPVVDIIQTYHELNAAVVDELHEEPSPLEFMRFVARNRPFVVRGAGAEWVALQKWDVEYLKDEMGDDEVRVAVTPKGDDSRWTTRELNVKLTRSTRNADAVVEHEDGTLTFVEPHEIHEPFATFLDSLNENQDDSPPDRNKNVKYAQPQNDSLRTEYAALYSDIPADISFARIAVEQPAEAINIWIGDDRSTTSLHKDNYENIYVQVRGRKHFVLLPPVEMPCFNETLLRKGRYVSNPLSGDRHEGSGDEPLEVKVDVNAERVPVAIWDPDLPSERTTKYSHLAKPLRVTLRPGDMLYLPAMWYHKVSQTVGEDDFVCAVNYWYDMDFSGHFWASNAFIRNVYQAEQRRPEYPDLEMNTEGGREK